MRTLVVIFISLYLTFCSFTALLAQRKTEACDLLSKIEAEELTGELVKTVTNQTKGEKTDVSTCKYRLGTFSFILGVSEGSEDYEQELSLLTDAMNIGTVKAEKIEITSLGDKATWIEGPVMGILKVVKGKYIISISSFSRKPAANYLSVDKKLAERVLSHLSQ